MKRQNLGYRSKVFFTTVLTAFGTIVCNVQSNAQTPPVNDECSGALTLPVGSVCTPVNGTTTNATESTTAMPLPTCGAAAGGWDDDVWFVVNTGNSQTSLDVNFNYVAGTTDVIAQLYKSSDGTCQSLTPESCSDQLGVLPQFSNVTVTPNTTYFIRVFTYGIDQSADFTICAMIPPQPPVNDDCSGAVVLPVTLTCNDPINGTTVGATESAIVPTATCAAEQQGWDDDVWYAVTTDSTQTMLNINFTSISGTNDIIAQMYTSSDGTCTGVFTAVACSDEGIGFPELPQFVNQPVLPNTTYFIRVFTYYRNTAASFTICATNPSVALPLSGGKLAGIIKEGFPHLNWSIFNEGNNHGFDIQRSEDGRTFTKVGFVSPLTNNGGSVVYTYVDTKPVSAPVYYRWQQKGNEGKITFSNIVRLSTTENSAMNISAVPNPVKGTLTIKAYGAQRANTYMYITDITGKVLNKIPVTGIETIVNMESYSSGIYFLKYSDEAQTRTLKIVKQ